jgi:hypothetical protein
VTPEEKAVIDAAIYLRYCINAKTAGDPPRIGRLLDVVDELILACPRCNAGGHVCPGYGASIGHTDTACAACNDPESITAYWYPRTYADVRTGDTIRHTADAPPAIVLSCSQESRHVKDGGTGKHWDDAAVEHMLTRVRLDYPGSDPDRILDIPSTLPVEIRLTAEEFHAIELLGWENRV